MAKYNTVLEIDLATLYMLLYTVNTLYSNEFHLKSPSYGSNSHKIMEHVDAFMKPNL